MNTDVQGGCRNDTFTDIAPGQVALLTYVSRDIANCSFYDLVRTTALALLYYEANTCLIIIIIVTVRMSPMEGSMGLTHLSTKSRQKSRQKASHCVLRKYGIYC